MMKRRAAVGAMIGAALGPTLAGRSAAAEIDEKSPRTTLPAGRSIVAITLPPDAFVSIAVLGPPSSLLGLESTGGREARRVRKRATIEEDGLLPRVLSFLTEPSPEPFELIVDVVDPVEVMMVATPVSADAEPSFKGLKDGKELPRALVGFPIPKSDKDGYVLQSAARYVFARIDVVKSMMVAFEKVQKRFGADPIAISDASQWNGKRPKTDLGRVRHISHEGGCDVDIAIPANDGVPSTVRDHCKGVRLETDRFGCSPGTAKGVDFDRLAFFLGTLADEAPGRIVKVFLDDVYRREVVRAAPSLKERGFIKEPGLVALGEDGVLVASPWHTDHVHVRFAGEKARVLF